jgi:hypothetical protein
MISFSPRSGSHLPTPFNHIHPLFAPHVTLTTSERIPDASAPETQSLLYAYLIILSSNSTNIVEEGDII